MVLEIKNLQKRYGDRPVLTDLSLSIGAGEIYGLLGPNGAGKTTTINLLCGLVTGDGGEILLHGQRLNHGSKGIIGVAPQENLLYQSLTCRENLDFYAQIYGLTGQRKKERIEATLRAINLFDRAQTPVENLSGGMQRRMNMAIALVHQPQLLILDEPTTGLDIETRFEIWRLIEQLRREGMTILLTTHLLDEAERLCQRIGILKQGHIVAEGSLAELKTRVPAAEIAILKTPEPQKAIAIGQTQGLSHRYYGDDLAFWLPENFALQEILDLFHGVPIDGISRLPVALEHIYLEVTQG